MYQLLVFYPGEETPRVILNAPKSVAALRLIPGILAEHEGCAQVVVMIGTVRLFAVDAAGNPLP